MSDNKDYKLRTLKTPDGRIVTYFDGKLHNWDEPAIKYPKEDKKKDEYFLYGRQYTKDEWLEARRDREGIPPEKSASVTVIK